LNEIEGIDIDLGILDVIDGGFLVICRSWSVAGDSIDIDLESWEIEVSGTLPIVGTKSVSVHEEGLVGRTGSVIAVG